MAAKRLIALLAVFFSLAGTSAALSASPASASTSRETIGARILDIAETRTGDPYAYGGAGPSAFDCSGLLWWASHKAGVNLPRTTYQIIRSGLLHRVYSPRRGDLAFWVDRGGAYHVEMVTDWRNVTYGARNTGTRVGWNNDQYFHPNEFFRIE